MPNLQNKGRGVFGAINVRDELEVGGELTIADQTVPRMLQRIEVSNTAGNGGAFGWEVPVDCLVGPVLVHTVDSPGAARTIDIGVTTAANLSADNVMDGYQIGTTDGKNGNSLRNPGSNGRGIHYAAEGSFVTGTLQSALTGTFEINVYIFYTPLGGAQ